MNTPRKPTTRRAPATLKPAERAVRAAPEAPKTAAPTAPPTPVKSAASPRAVKRRAPADLSGQYGRDEKKAKPAPVAALTGTTKPVLRGKAAKEAKEQRRQVIAVSDDVLARLKNTSVPKAKKLLVVSTGEAAPKRGTTECGKCGSSRKFTTPATLCGCGAILVKA